MPQSTRGVDGNVLDAIARAKRGPGRPRKNPTAAQGQPIDPKLLEAAQKAMGEMPGDPGDRPPASPEDLPPELAEAFKQAQQAGAGGGGLLATGKRAAKYVQLERELAVLLCMPGAGFERAGDEYCAKHFMMQGPLLAANAVRYAETHKAFYELLVRIVETGGIFTLSLAVAMYAIPPILHHTGGPEPLRKVFGVPENEKDVEHDNAQT